MKGIEAYIVLVFGWLIFLFSHSFLASESVKDKLQSSLRLSQKTYRLLYNALSGMTLLAVLFINGMIKSARLLPVSSLLQYVSLFLAGGGIIVIRAAFRQYDIKSFIGLRQEEAEHFNTGGILNYVRHPIYSGTVLIVLGFLLYDLRWPTVISSVCIFIYLPFGIWHEERRLIKAFGDEYVEYKKNTPALFPKIRFWN